MRVLGVDTSLRSTGYGVLETQGSRLVAIDCGNIKNPAKLPLSACVAKIFEKISALVAEHKPDVVAVEQVIYAKNASSMLILGEARGAVIAAATIAGVPIYEYEPRRAKRAVCGNALAEKEQVQRMIKTLLALPEIPQNDAADALALAIAHVHSNRFAALSVEEPI